MRDLLFKNLTSENKKRKIIASSEISCSEGVRTAINRHFICMVSAVEGAKLDKPLPSLYILKQRNTKEKTERFFAKIKGSIYAICGKEIYIINYMHSLKISLEHLSERTLNPS